MEATKTETLTDVLKDLAGMITHRFRVDKLHAGSLAATLDGRVVYEENTRKPIWLAVIQAACQEECEARGWLWAVGKDADGNHRAELSTGEFSPDHQLGRRSDCPALALATALRDAIRASS